jgi:glycerol kinase
MTGCIVAIDQGTTSSRCILFDPSGRALATAQREFIQYYPADGWVEHDPEEIWRSVLDLLREALQAADAMGRKVAGIGITNQRETTVIWRRADGKPIHNAIVWQDRRTAEACRKLQEEGFQDLVQSRTGLLLDPYFSASKVAWILDSVEGARAAAERGELAFGTIDSFLLWRLTGGARHATDATNASRTALFDIHRQEWDPELLALFRVPAALLPDVLDNAADFGSTVDGLLPRRLAIGGMAGDQQAAAIGQACVQPGMVKSTYGTGCFMLLNTGAVAVSSRHALLTTLAYRLKGETAYAVEGSIFVAGAAVQWLRDGLRLIGSAAESESLAAGLGHNAGVYLVPAFTGLGAPHWDADARGAIFGLTRASGAAEIVRAALEAVCYQTHDLLSAMRADGAGSLSTIRVDGGMVANGWLMQFLADILDLPVERPRVTETTALGAAFLAGLQLGVFDRLDDVERFWELERRFTPQMAEPERAILLQGWQRAVAKVRTR